MKGWGGQTLVHLGAAPSREGLGGSNPCPFVGAAPSREGLGGSNLCPFAEPLQVVKGWGGPTLVHLGGRSKS